MRVINTQVHHLCLEFVGLNQKFDKFLNDTYLSKCNTLKYIHLLSDSGILSSLHSQYTYYIGIKKAVYECSTVKCASSMTEIEFPENATLNGAISAKIFAPNKPFKIDSMTFYCDIVDLTNCTTEGFPYPTYFYGNSNYMTGSKIILNPNLLRLSKMTTHTITYNTVGDIKLPSSLIEFDVDFYRCTYIELFNDFNITGVNFTGQINKEFRWLRDLCIWLKDRTGEEAGTMIIGGNNINNASNIYLTFNPNDKRDITFDGVTAETEGAVSITDFITNQLNWTLS